MTDEAVWFGERDPATVIADYVPGRVDRATWQCSAELVRRCVTISEPATSWAATNRLRAVAHYVAWAVDHGVPADAERLFLPETVERYVTDPDLGLLPRSLATRRSILRLVGRAATRRAPWPPDPGRIPRSTLAAPYGPPEVARLWAVIDQQSTPAKTRAAAAVLALGLGAGLRPSEIVTADADAVVERDALTLVKVPGLRRRMVPVLPVYAGAVRTLAATHRGQRLAGRVDPRATSAAYKLSSRITIPRGAPPLSLRRLRTTWMVTVLTAGLRIPEFLALAGITSTKALGDLAPYMPSRDADDVARLLTAGPQ